MYYSYDSVNPADVTSCVFLANGPSCVLDREECLITDE